MQYDNITTNYTCMNAVGGCGVQYTFAEMQQARKQGREPRVMEASAWALAIEQEAMERIRIMEREAGDMAAERLVAAMVNGPAKAEQGDDMAGKKAKASKQGTCIVCDRHVYLLAGGKCWTDYQLVRKYKGNVKAARAWRAQHPILAKGKKGKASRPAEFPPSPVPKPVRLVNPDEPVNAHAGCFSIAVGTVMTFEIRVTRVS